MRGRGVIVSGFFDQDWIRYRGGHFAEPSRHCVERRSDVGLDSRARLAIVAAKDRPTETPARGQHKEGADQPSGGNPDKRPPG
jgi:hypothetical protein